MRMMLLLVLLSHQLLAMESDEVEIKWVTYPQEFQFSNPFREGVLPDQKYYYVPNFDQMYDEYQPEILEDLGPEITEFYNRYDEANATHSIEKYIHALVVRLALKSPRSRKIEIVKTTIPANISELNYILGNTIELEENEHSARRKILDDYFAAVREHMLQIKSSELPKIQNKIS